MYIDVDLLLKVIQCDYKYVIAITRGWMGYGGYVVYSDRCLKKKKRKKKRISDSVMEAPCNPYHEGKKKSFKHTHVHTKPKKKKKAVKKSCHDLYCALQPILFDSMLFLTLSVTTSINLSDC